MTAKAVFATLRASALRTEAQVRPIGLGSLPPRLEWRLEGVQRQTAYQVKVARMGEQAPLWDTGRVASDEQTVLYAGAELESRATYRWRVRVWDAAGRSAPWSEPAIFEMGLLQPGDWCGGWIGGVPLSTTLFDLDDVSRIRVGSNPEPAAGGFRCHFTLNPAVTSARLLAQGGTLEAWVNGTPIGTSPASAVTDVEVAPALRSGENVLALRSTGGAAGLIAALAVSFADGSTVQIGSDDSWLGRARPESGWSDPLFDDTDWAPAVAAGRYGDPPWGRDPISARTSPLLRRSFSRPAGLRRARIHATALGLYELYLNGMRISNACLAPGWTDYRHRVRAQTYDVTHLLVRGENVLGAILADGWYAGHVGLWGRARYGGAPLLRAQLELETADGQRQIIATDGDWVTESSDVLYADLLMGQTIDHRQSLASWCRSGTRPEDWQPVQVSDVEIPIVPDPGPPSVVTQELVPIAVVEQPDGRFQIDIGQNMVGWVRLRARGMRGQKIVLTYAEAVQPDGSLYRGNLRSAQAVDEFILGGEDEEVFEPRFTYHGFRYLEVSGFPGRLRPEDVTGCVVGAEMEATGEFECSNADLNRLQANIVWGQRGNFLSIPTDCPQRDERLGWTGDAQVFASTAMFNFDARRFLDRWVQDVVEAQLPDGSIPDVVPEIAEIGAGAGGWGDAVVIVPWVMHRLYGDRRVVALAQSAIERWLDYLVATSDGLIRPDKGYGDWLSVDAQTPKDLVGTAYFAYSAQLAAELARALGEEAAAARHETLFTAVRRAFRRRFVRGGGRVVSETQTAYVLALKVGLLDALEEEPAVERLVADIQSRNWHLSTGFLGTPWLLPVLALHGRLDVAYRLLQQDSYPSWLHQVRNGATTMWERWDTYTEGKGFHTSHTTEGHYTAEMNSLNHYAYGCVGAFIYESLGGIACLEPGYARVRIAPRPAPGVTWARTSLQTPRGEIACSWRLNGSDLDIDVGLASGMTGELVLPVGTSEVVEEIGPGRHRFSTQIGK